MHGPATSLHAMLSLAITCHSFPLTFMACKPHALLTPLLHPVLLTMLLQHWLGQNTLSVCIMICTSGSVCLTSLL